MMTLMRTTFRTRLEMGHPMTPLEVEKPEEPPAQKTGAATAEKLVTSLPSAKRRARDTPDTASPFAPPRQQEATSAAITTLPPVPNLASGTLTTFATTATRGTTKPLSVLVTLAKTPTVPSKAQTPLRAEVFERLLAHHPDAELRMFVSVSLRQGVDLRYTGPLCSRTTQNSVRPDLLCTSRKLHCKRSRPGTHRGPLPLTPFSTLHE